MSADVMDPDAVEAILAEGGLLAPDVVLDRSIPADRVSARRYEHPALAGRPVVRLVGDTVAPGEDQALAFLGFGEPVVTGPLATGARKGLGFPAWVLVNDPANAGEALAIVKDMERTARVARSKPGNAAQAYEKLARELPHHAHLPSFWEQAGRAFIASGNNQQAATMFEKARVAERVYALDVDEAARRTVFLEFAFAGALTAKSITAYVNELVDRYPPVEAYDALVQLALRRTLGGLPPWTDMPKQLRKLAKAAGLDLDAEDERILGQLLSVPATALAAAGFWKAYRSALVKVSGRSPVIRGQLLNLFPKPSAYDNDFDDWWLTFLADAGALDGFAADASEVEPGAEPLPSAARWLERLVAHSTRGYRSVGLPPPLFDLLPRIADRLTLDGEAVDITVNRRLDANLADACLAAGVPLADPSAGASIDLTAWLMPNRFGGSAPTAPRRSLGHLVADQRFRRIVADAIPGFCAYGQVNTTLDDLLDFPALEPLVRDWLATQIEALPAGGAIHAGDVIGGLETSIGPRTLGRIPEARSALEQVDLTATLTRTLRAGILDELGWPALDVAVEELAEDTSAIASTVSWPVLCVFNRNRAIAVGPDGRVAEHDLRCPGASTWGVPWALYAGGQFFVRWHDGSAWKAYWSGAPNDVFEPGGERTYDHWWGWHAVGVLLGDGSRLSGGRAFAPGDRREPPSLQVLGDGASFWVCERSYQGGEVRELDPATGERGRRSMPSFFEDVDLGPGESLDVTASSLLALLAPSIDAGAALADSPLGALGNLVGFRVVEANGSVVRVDGIDGRRFDVPPLSERPPAIANEGPTRHRRLGSVAALVAFPGSEALRVVEGSGASLWDPQLGVFAAVPRGSKRRGGSREHGPRTARLDAAGTPFSVPAELWHLLRPRDPAGSDALRSMTDDQATTLLRAAAADLAEDRNLAAEKMDRTRQAVTDVLPAITDQRLALGVAGSVRAVHRWTRDGAAILAKASTPDAAAAPSASEQAAKRLDASRVLPALAGLGGRITSYGNDRGATGQHIDQTAKFLGGDTDLAHAKGLLGTPVVSWHPFVGRIGALAARVASPLTSVEDRTCLLDLLELWATTPFSSEPGAFHETRATTAAGPKVLGEGSRGRWVIVEVPWYGDGARQFLERRTGDACALPDDFRVEETSPCPTGWGTPEQIAGFVAHLRAHGPVPWDPDVAPALAARTGLSLAEASVLWGTLPNLDAYENAYLTTEQRGQMGLKTKDASVARDTMRKLSVRQRSDVLAAALGGADAAADALWNPLGRGADDDTSPVALLAARWNALFGKRESVPDEALASIRSLGRATDAGTLVRTLHDPASSPALTETRTYRVFSAGRSWDAYQLKWHGTDQELTPTLGDLAFTIPWAATTRPAGDSLRRALPQLLELARARLDDPATIIGPLTTSMDGPALPPGPGSTPYRDPDGVVLTECTDDGVLISAPFSDRRKLYWRPGAAASPEDTALIEQSAQARPWGQDANVALTVELLRSPGFAALAERGPTTPVPAGEHEADPAASVPELGAAAADVLGASPDAACLYLQLLTLLEPTDRAVRTWNGWTPARHKKVVAELVTLGLVIEAKRERAGRTTFVPGGWAAAKAPNLPLETWKLDLYDLHLDAETGRPVGPLARYLPLRPLHELFEAAWHRWTSGDRPGS